MKLFFTIILYFFIALLIIENQIILAVLLAGWFTFRVGAIWLIPLAFLLDGYFGAFTDVPAISLITCVWYVVSEYLRPRLIAQSQSYEKVA
jgi:hypothetical protein